ncbi:26S proteasome non-ATPase regulatory subunit 11 [Symbiodinium microadriaticum]|uniref:26S proteasome non-ATPase regulatory subunit 11 n=1 Tax=Symbiodinium microadriaticum TaxID=2951 RepID=A0A1Q9F1G7_SYMMI|nr:26S proteasome non-ATPase regulatory subunit 11 [Symbiodinium microadriaticum]
MSSPTPGFHCIHNKAGGEKFSLNYPVKAGSLVFIHFSTTVNTRVFEKQAENQALGDLLVAKKLPQDISSLSKAKTAKIVRHLIDLLAKTENSQAALQIEMCKDCIEWCKGEKRTFLPWPQREAKAALTAAKTNATASEGLRSVQVCTGSSLDSTEKSLTGRQQSGELLWNFIVVGEGLSRKLPKADIDLLSGIISAREKDYRTAFSYFYEGFEAFHQSNSTAKARKGLKYMLLSKIMSNQPKETSTIISSKSGAVALAILAGSSTFLNSRITKKARSLKKFEAVLEQHKHQLSEDPIIQFHLSDLNETLLEQNILRISHVAELIELPLARTQAKLSEMILDQKLNGTLDQGVGVLIVYDEEQVSSTYENSLKTIKNTAEVLDTLYTQAKQLA